MKPLSNFMLIEPEAVGETTRGGLYVPEQAKEKPVKGKVVAVGPGRTEAGQTIPMQVSIGDNVLYARYSGIEVSEQGRTMLLVRETDALAVL